MDEIYDCIVVGVGAMGSAAVYQLAHQSEDCKLLGIDRFSPPHTHGSSHGGSRVIRLATAGGEAYLPVVKRSHEIITELQRNTICPKGRSFYVTIHRMHRIMYCGHTLLGKCIIHWIIA